jgi:hypothetical protein
MVNVFTRAGKTPPKIVFEFQNKAVTVDKTGEPETPDSRGNLGNIRVDEESEVRE